MIQRSHRREVVAQRSGILSRLATGHSRHRSWPLRRDKEIVCSPK